MSAAVIAETPVGFRTWARPGTCHTSTNAVSAPHRAAYARDFMNPSSVSTVIRQVARERLGENRDGSHGRSCATECTDTTEQLKPRSARTPRKVSGHGLHGHHGGTQAAECTDTTEGLGPRTARTA